MKHPRRTVAALLCALAVALGVAVAPAPAHAAGEADVVTLYAIEGCSECGRDHYGWDTTTAGGLETFDRKIDYVEYSDYNVVTALAVASSDGSGKVVELHAMRPGDATVTVHYQTAAGEPVPDETNTIYVEVKAVSDPAEVPAERQALINHSNAVDVYRFRVEMNDPSGGLSDGWISSEKFFEQSIAATLAENYYDLQPGEEVMLGDGNMYVFQGWYLGPTGLEVDDVPVVNEYTFQDVSEKVDPVTGVTTIFHDQTIEATWNPTSETGVWEPWVPGEGNTLLPYTREGGVLSFVDAPKLGEWYQLDFRCGEGVSYNGVVAGGTSRTMTIERTCLAEDDELYDANAYAEGPIWSRGDHGEDCTSVAFEIPADGTVAYRLEPADAGSLSVQSIGSGQLVLGVQLSKPATLVVEPSETATITNEQGATLTAPVNASDPTYYNWMTLKTEHIGGDVAQTAVDSVVAVIDNVTGHPYVFDISMIDPAGDEVQPLEGDTVTVTLPIPEGLSPEGLHVFHVADDGTVTDMNATVDAAAGTVSFETTHFSTFVLANVKVNETSADTTKPAGEKNETETIPAAGDPGSLAVLLAGGAGSLAVLTGVAIRRRR